MKPNAYLRLSGRQWQMTRRIPGTDRRLIVNLGTSDLIEARRRRDQIWAQYLAENPLDHETVALSISNQEDEEARDAAATAFAEGQESKVGTDEAIRLFKIASGVYTPVTAYLDAFVSERPCAPTTRLARLTSIRSLPFRSVQQVSKKEAGRYVSQLSETGMAPATVNSRISHLKNYWSFLEAKGIVTSNPWMGQAVKRDRRLRMKSGSQVWTFPEVGYTLRHCDEKLRSLFTVLLYSGTRCGELAELRVKDVHADNFHILEGKTVSATRSVYLPKRIMAVIHKLCEGQPANAHVFLRGIPCGGVRARPGAISKALSKELRRLFPEYKTKRQRNALKTTHGLRKLWVSCAEQEGVPLHIFQSACGHQRSGVTLTVYSEGPKPEQIKDCFKKVGARIDSELKARRPCDLPADNQVRT